MNRFFTLATIQKMSESFLILVALFFMIVSPVQAQTQAWTGVCVGPDVMNTSADGTVTAANDVATLQGLECLIANVFTVILSIIGMAGFIMFIVGSFRYMTSGGNSKGVETAKHTFTFAVIGLVIALSGFILLNLLATFTGIPFLTRFAIPSSDWGLGGQPDSFPEARNER